MEPTFKLSATDKKGKYEEFIPGFSALIEDESEAVSILANASAALKEAFGFFWVGFYIVKGEELVLGPFQGSVACYRIKKGRGVCGTAWSENRTVIVPDVEEFPGHIACSSLSRSEIVVPLYSSSGEMVAVLDIDSDRVADFDETDRFYLEKIVGVIAAALRHL
ncbi:MAG: GAF domain-containing protein [Bacteroides sp.]|nr:GAF domain-containing protein [Roseburia sp.]MCM1347351.1 GAF domain-containing protein [Bacteroides sp.]MCM1421388.1 GAF domain-containing protein [Bacteroides sp.]